MRLDIDMNPKMLTFWNGIFNPDQTIKLNQYDEFAFWGGYGCGKTLTVLLSIYCMCNKYPGCVITVIRETYNQLDDTVIHDFNTMFQLTGYRHSVAAKELHFSNGSKIRFRAFDVPEKILGGSIDVIVVSQAEQIPHGLFTELFGRQRGKSILPKKILITEGNPAPGWAEKRYNRPVLPENILYVQGSTLDNQNYLSKHNPKYISNMRENMTDSEFNRKVLGDWNVSEEMVFSEFKIQFNVVDTYSDFKYWSKIVVGGDYGYKSPSAFIWIVKDPDGNLIVFDEFKRPGCSTDELALVSNRHGKHPVVYDYSTKRPDRDGKSVWTDLQSKGVPLIEANKDELRNISVVNRKFKRLELYITRNCVELIEEIKNYRWKKVRVTGENAIQESPVDRDNHLIDSLLYAIAYIEDLNSEDPKLKHAREHSLHAETTRKKQKTFTDRG